MKDQQIVELVNKQIKSEIDKFKNKMGEIFSNEIKSLDEKLAQVESLIKEYMNDKNDNTSRDAQRSHENNDAPLSRNRVIIQAEINAHKLNFDSDSNHHSKGEWESKLIQLQKDLKNSPN